MSEIKLHHVELHDFKSFGGEHYIGPFENFSGIIGPNGSGKSSILESIAFALLLDLSPRSTNYIHQGGEYEPDNCSVKVCFTGDVDETFERIINKKEENIYLHNDKDVSEEEYKKAIHELNIIPLAFVKQGDVDVIARKTPLELTQLFEEMSGSAQYADDYDRLRLDTESTHEAVNLLDKRRRAALSEKRHISARKEEAARFRSLSADEEKIQIEMSLFQLYHGKKRVEQAEEENTAYFAQKMEITAKAEKKGQKLREMEKASKETHDKFLKIDNEYQEIEQKLRNVRAEKLKENEKNIVISERLESTKNKIEANQKAFDESENNLNEMKNEREQILKQIDELPVVEKLEKEIAEYNTLRERASKQFSDVTFDLRTAVQERNTVQHKLDDLNSQKDSEEASNRKIQDSINITKEELKKMKSRYAQVEKERTKIGTDLAMKKRADSVDVEKQTELNQKLKEKQRKYEEIRRSKGTSKRREKIKKAVQTMQRLFPGVYGRFFDLCQPVHKKYNLAVYEAASGYADSILVKDKEVGRRCIEYLKEQGAGQVLFLPLKALAIPQIHTKSSIKILSTVMKYDKLYKPAVDYVCGSIALCSNLSEATDLAFKENMKTVTLDGSVVDPSGIISGGKSREEPRFEDVSIEDLEQECSKMETDLAILGDQIEKRRNEIENDEEQLLSLEPQQKHLNQRIRDLEEKIKRLEIDQRNTSRQITTTEKNIKLANSELEQKDEIVQSLGIKQAKIDKAIFEDFCKKTGVQDIREFEVTRIQNFEERYAKRLQLQSRLSQIENFIALEEKRDPQSSIELLITRKEELEKQQKETKESLEQLNADFETISNQAENIKQERLSIMAEDESNRLELKQIHRENQEITDELEQINDQASIIEHEKNAAMQSLSSILQQCKLSNIQLPHIKEVPEVEMTNTPSSFTQEILDKNELDIIDFSKLSAAKRTIISKKEYEQTVKEYEDNLASIRIELNQIRPDLKSDDRYTEVEKELDKMSIDQETYRKKASEASKAFNEIKQKRRDLFMALYDAIDSTIDKIYKKLTRVRNQESRSGTAYLALEDTEEPYLGGIKFTAMPPHKRFRDLEQLSGGEKAVASLALILALQKEIKAPFILMDEPDASLDKLNLRSAAIALREMVNNSQIIAVSLRDKFFEYSDILVGVYKDIEKQSSGIITLNLRSFIEQNLVMEDLE